MSAINQMLRDLDKRSARAHADTVPGVRPPSAAAPAPAPSKLAGAYASVRMMGPRTRLSRNVALVAGAAALLPIAWATTYLELPVLSAQPAPAQAAPVGAPVRVATAPIAAPAAAPMSALVTEPTVAPVPPPEAPVVLAAATVASTAAPSVLMAAVAPAAAAPVLPLAVVEVPPRPAAPAAMVVAPPAPKNRPVRAPVMAALDGEDETPAPTARPVARPAAPKDTRLALASPTVQKDETRIERRPTDARDDLVRAGEAMSIGRTSDAIVLLRKVIQAEPDNERARLALLSLLAERGRDDAWRSTLTESARVLPRRFGLAAAQGLAETGRFEESLAVLQGLPESMRDTRYFSALGATHQQLNQHAEAVAAFDAALGKAGGSAPQLPSLLVAQALSMQSLGNAVEARRNLERVRQMPEAAADVREFAVRELAHTR